MKWKKENPIDQKEMHIGCLNCSPVTHKLDMKRILAVGFGEVTVTRDGYCMYSESECDVHPIAQFYEDEAAKYPDHDWRIHFFAPLHEEEYQRHGPENWVMISSGPGFA